MHNELSQRPMEIDKTANGSTVMGGGCWLRIREEKRQRQLRGHIEK